jgi:tungstate transport system ATP-binding protein
MKPEPVYRLHNVTRCYGDSFQLRLGSLDILEGECFCLLGPTGAGKSTLLRLLSGFESPETGDIIFDGTRWNGARIPLKIVRQIATVHQRTLLLSGTVHYNVTYGLTVRELHNPKLVEQTIDQLGLRKYAHQSARTLSGGQIQLVALARALVLEPKVLLLDEPTANLDPAHVAIIEQVLAEVQSRHKTTIVWATHNVFQARRVAKQVGLLLNGELIEVADTEQFFNSPADCRAQDFVEGRMIY